MYHKKKKVYNGQGLFIIFFAPSSIAKIIVKGVGTKKKTGILSAVKTKKIADKVPTFNKQKSFQYEFVPSAFCVLKCWEKGKGSFKKLEFLNM